MEKKPVQLQVPSHLASAIKAVSNSFGEKHLWAITGSANLALRGAKIIPGDLDIITSEEGAKHLATTVPNLTFVFSETKAIKSLFARTSIDGTLVEVMADASILLNPGNWYSLSRWVEAVEQMDTSLGLIPLVSLQFEKEIYSLLGKEKQLNAIAEINNI